MSKRKIGDIVTGKIVKIMPNGAVLSIGYNETAFLHVSEVSEGYTENIEEKLTKGEKITVEIVDIKNSKNYVSLKKMTKEKVDAEVARKQFEEKIQNFLKIASENQKAIQKTQDKKRRLLKKNNLKK